MVGQHDAAGADSYRLRSRRDVADDDGGRGARDADHVVVLRQPETVIAPTLGVLREIERVVERLRRASKQNWIGAVQCITMHCIMDSQLTVRLPDDLRRALDSASRKTGLKSSELVRDALRSYLKVSPNRRDNPAARVRRLIGSLESGVPDLAERHRDYIIESLKRGR